jgi:hypothetical protein
MILAAAREPGGQTLFCPESNQQIIKSRRKIREATCTAKIRLTCIYWWA